MRRAASVAAFALGLAVEAGAGAQNLLANPDFDQDLTGWTLYQGTSVIWSTADESACSQSGSALGHTDQVPSGQSSFTLGQCLSANGLASLAASGRYREGSQVNGLVLYFHQAPDCSDTTGVRVISTPSGPSPGAWIGVEIPETEIPQGTQAIRLEIGSGHLAGFPIDVEIDRVYLGESERIFAENFEANGGGSGDLCRWSATVN